MTLEVAAGNIMERLLAYQGPAGAFDEFKTPDGHIKPQWHKLLESLGNLDEADLSTRLHSANRILQENGVNLTGFDHDRRSSRPWEIDLLPAMYSAADWKIVRAGIAQRAQLMEAIVRDLYGSQTLISDGLIPTDLIFKNKQFLRSFHNLPPESSGLLLYGCELGRSTSGQWWVMADRANAPAGVSYTLENRIVISKTLPQFLRECQVHRLAPFFIQLQETIKQLSSHKSDNPSVVILSAGPTEPFYFEDVFLARYLGYTLVEADDLTVRKNHVWLKTLTGLVGVDVIIRRHADQNIDPLEVGGYSPNGISGLLNAMRHRNVVMLNGPEFGLLDSPVFMPFMKKICQHFLGEDLLIPSIATWWCGQKREMDYVKVHFNDLVIKPAFAHSGGEEFIVSDLDKESQQKLMAKIEARPWSYIAQEKIVRSTAPCWIGDYFHPGHMALRTFAVKYKERYEVMNGGLIRVEERGAPMPLSISAGHCSKDVWVCSNKPVPPVSLLAKIQERPEIKRSNNQLPSRAADNLYWLGRYIERLEFTGRLIRKVSDRMLSEFGQQTITDIMPMVACLAEQGGIEESLGLDEFIPSRERMEKLWPAIIWENENSGKLQGLCENVIRLSSLVRDRMTDDFWRATLQMQQTIKPEKIHSLSDLQDLTNSLMLQISAISGQITDGLVHGPTRHFLLIGRGLERSRQLTLILRQFLKKVDDKDVMPLVTLLDVCNSIMTYRSRYRANFSVLPVFDLLVTDSSNPHALVFQFNELRKLLAELPYRDRRKPLISPERDIVRCVRYELQSLLPTADRQLNWVDYRHGLEKILNGMDKRIHQISSQLTSTFFVLSEFTQQVDDHWENRNS
ncbi:hypothetical protein Pan54_17820 [Rubinisphaera italica]|uniref:Uncharacterized protein n=2 Tax=Rubinisphaera italica TaxID=2527969 RepID=A0A5C5XE08_9PLAN|nr:hypothetical protein Pan54_17820 [Rubinisphaera italica]